MKKIVLKVNMDDEKSKKKILKTIAGIEGVESVAMDMKERKITVIGEADPVFLVVKLRKFGFTDLISVGPAKEVKNVAGKEVSAIEEQESGRKHYLGVQNTGFNRAAEHEGSKKRTMEAVAGFGDFISIAVDVEKGMVTIVGNLVPVSVAMKVRELGYRAKLVSVGSVDVAMKDMGRPYQSHTPYPYTVVKEEDDPPACALS